MELCGRQMAGDGAVGEAVRTAVAIDEEIGGPASRLVAEIPVPGGIEGDDDLVDDFGELIAGDIDNDAVGFDPGVTLAVEAADSVDVFRAGEPVLAKEMAQQKADLAAGRLSGRRRR